MSEPAGPVYVAGLILAGGASRRMGSPKALLQIGSQTFIDRLVGVFSPVVDRVLVVLGHDSELIRDGMDPHTPALIVVNPRPERGMLSSLQSGLTALPSETGAVIFMPVDYPDCQGTTVARIAAEFRASARKERCDVVIPTYRGVKGHPVGISRRIVDQLLHMPFTGQARDVIRRHMDSTLLVEVDDSGITADIDTPEDYQRLLGSSLTGVGSS